ncbi:MAG: hypothetical protein HQ537_02340 [Parcubacteria group bacterium]|nr:hypothetical protein [Parcubacteria group bacterium]
MDLSKGTLQVKTSEVGARVSFLQKDNKHFIFPQQIIKERDRDMMRGGMHPCSPIFGKKTGEFNAIPQHGGLRDIVWQIKSQRNNSVEYECKFELEGYRLAYNVCYRLLGHCLQAMTIIKNRLNMPVPFEFGWHPYFFAPNGADISFIGSGTKPIHIDQSYGPRIFADNKIVEIKLHNIGTVNLLFGKGFVDRYVCIWTDNKQYVCVEPLLSHPDDFNTEKGFFLEPYKPFDVDFIMWFN